MLVISRISAFYRAKIQVLAALVLTLILPSQALGERDIKTFFFGNSLINHVSDSEQTTVPYWLHHLAEAGGNGFAADGTFGFLRNFAAELPPSPKWSFRDVPSAWKQRQQAFRRVGFDSIVISPTNFIQYQASDRPYDGDNPRADSPLSVTTRVLDWVETNARGARVFIYEGWADMEGVVRGFPPNARALRRYHVFNQGDYHQWYVDYLAALQAEKPGLDIRLIPVAPVLARLFAETDLAALSATDLYTDNAPHGTPTLYFLASLITYSSLYGMPPPTGFVPPDTLHPLVRENYPHLAALVWAATGGSALPLPKKATFTPETGLKNPSLAMGLNGVSDWSTQQPFVDIIKTARPWVGHITGQWGGWDGKRLGAEGYLNAQGWPTHLPPDVNRLEALILTDQPAAAHQMANRYRVTYNGTGEITVVGRVTEVKSAPGEIWFNYSPGDDSVAISITATDPDQTGDILRDISVVREDHIPLFEVGALFNPDWLAHVRDLRSLRFMDWMFTNGSTISRWDQRPLETDYTYVRRGVPIEVILRLANETGTDPWLNIPHMADDAYAVAFAQMLRDGLDPRLRAYIEYSNEVWNFIFPQAEWARDQAAARWGDAAGTDGWMQFAGLRAAQLMDIVAREYGAEAPARLVRVIGAHTGWPGLEEPLLNAPLWLAENPANLPPLRSFDAYAVSGYFGQELGSDLHAPQLLDWIAAGDATHRASVFLQKGSLGDLVRNLFPHHAAVARRHGLQLIMYEGGSHVTGQGAWVDNETLNQFFARFNYSPEMAQLYALVLEGWRDAGGTLFNAFVDVAAPSKWGSWGALRHLEDTNPRWATLMAYNASDIAVVDNRAPDSFDHGVIRQGTDGPDELLGTPQEDVLLGLAGDDILHASARGDRLHGGPGNDKAILPGALDDYRLLWFDHRLIAEAAGGDIVMVAVELLEFTAEPGVVMRLGMPQ